MWWYQRLYNRILPSWRWAHMLETCLWYHHTYRCDDTRDCIIEFCPPDDEHMCSKHVEAWNKLIKFSASSWLILINKYIEMHGQQNIKISGSRHWLLIQWYPICNALKYIDNYMHHPINTRGFVCSPHSSSGGSQKTQIISIKRPLVLLMQRRFFYCQAGIEFLNIILIYFLPWKVTYNRHD